MAQRMIELQKELYSVKKFKNVRCQTMESDDLFFNLSKNKHGKIYYSKQYKSKVLSLNIHNSKSFIITKQIWSKLKEQFDNIDKALNDRTK
jgi:hypothetical protein